MAPKCKKGQMINPVSGRCVSRTGAIGRKLAMKKAPVKKRQVVVKRPIVKRVKQKAPMRRSGGRLSARAYWDMGGKDGEVCDIDGRGTMKCLRIRANGSPYWDSKNKKSATECNFNVNSCRI